MGRSLRIALLVESSHGFGRAVLQGIAEYAKTFGPWTFHHEERAFDDPLPEGLRDWKPDGVIARIADPSLARQLRRLRAPIVDLYERRKSEVHSQVLVNQRAIVRMAVDHLRECGLQHFAYVGFPRLGFSADRGRLFAECVALWRCNAHLYVSPSRGRSRRLADVEMESMRHAESLATWLDSLPKPVGLMACNDMRAQQVLAVCSEHGVAVPETVAVIGVDNDEVRCELASPSLSSIDPNAYRIGYEAAGLLHRLIRGQRKSPQTVVVDPAGVVRRRSTDVLAFVEPGIGEAVRYIQEHACKRLSVEKLVAHTGLSRATLDRWFLKNLGCTPCAEITRLQVRRVRELLAMTDLPLKQVARLAGFSHVETMYRVFGRATGQTPAQYRRTTSSRRSPLTSAAY
jgi:LacI family transcriptional regulator